MRAFNFNGVFSNRLPHYCASAHPVDGTRGIMFSGCPCVRARAEAVLRCGLLLHMSHRSVVFVLGTHTGELCKTAEPIVSRFESKLLWAQ